MTKQNLILAKLKPMLSWDQPRPLKRIHSYFHPYMYLQGHLTNIARQIKQNTIRISSKWPQ